MSTAGSETKIYPPVYVPYETFESFISTLSSTLVPPHIDRGMMGNLSGSVQGHLLSALKFLGLVVGKDGKVTDEFRQLVASHQTSEWKQTLQSLFKQAYSHITVDVTETTDRKLREAFETAFKINGSMLDRAVRFYIRGLKEAGVAVSPHVGKRKPRAAGVRRQKSPNTAGNGGSGNSTLQPPTPPAPHAPPAEITPKEMIDFPLPMGDKTGFIRVRADITIEQYPLVEAMLNAVKVLAKTNSGVAN
ncbi:MAG TPA: DUF5343 domain-containing protein [Planctomycetaceae bacterium]|jgi:hypothetical protein|nr:DUF5343 domain-containing protein [Planctomycetaceae bacterium]